MPFSSRNFLTVQVLFVAIGALALAAIVGVAIWLGARSTELVDEFLAARDLKSTALSLQAAILRAETSQRGYAYTDNEVYLAPYDLAKAEANRHVGSLPERLLDYSALGAASERLATAVAAKFSEMDETIRLKRQRQDAEALDLTLTNRGKALMDEINVYITGISLAADNRLSELATEQDANAAWQRLVAVIGALVAVAAALGGLLTITRYARELGEARDGLEAANSELEAKVAARTEALARSNEEMRAAKDRTEILMHEVNHRVANSLAMVSSLVGLQKNAVKGDERTAGALAETQSRIQAVALVHQRLYASGQVTEVDIDEYLRSVLEQFQSSTGSADRVTLTYDIEPVRLPTDATINLGVVAAEWVMNATKYAYPDSRGEVRVKLERQGDGSVVFSVADDGVGRGDGAAKGTGLGSRIVTAMARSLSGQVEYLDGTPGLLARLMFPMAKA
jgi:two-component sensor histidine kinase